MHILITDFKKCLFGPNSQKGSVTILFAFLLPIMFLLIFLVADVTQLVFDKIRLQQAADVSALSGATVQAVGMNEIADLNNELRLELSNLRQYLSSEKWRNRREGMQCVNYFRDVFSSIHKYQNNANIDFQVLAKKKAIEAFRSNQPAKRDWHIQINTSPSNKLIKYTTMKRSVDFRYISILDRSCEHVGDCHHTRVLYWNSGTAGPKSIHTSHGHDGRYFWYLFQDWYIIDWESKDVKVKIKKTNDLTKITTQLTQFPTKYIFASNLFGYTPALHATATAKPTGGHIYDYKPQYKAVLIN